MHLTCFLHPGWQPLIRPAPAKRDWMDATPESFAYRCLPLNIANAHGWELLNPCAFEACWNGQTDTGAVTIRPHAEGPAASVATSLFGRASSLSIFRASSAHRLDGICGSAVRRTSRRMQSIR